MVGLCQEEAARAVGDHHRELPPTAARRPRGYATIFCLRWVPGLGSTRKQDQEALRRLHDHLEPGGRLVLDNEVPYSDATHWSRWTPGRREGLPEPSKPPGARRLGPDGDEYALESRLLDLDALRQQEAWEIEAYRWRDGELIAQERHQSDLQPVLLP